MPIIFSDREAISRALFNLLDNALKYSKDSPEISIQAWSDEENVFLEVHDKGIGISKEEQRKVFEKFYRSDNIHEGRIKGSGIGLPLVSHIIRAHGGEIFLESEVEKGTKITMKLPLKQIVQ